VRLTRICLLMALQGVIGIVQYRLHLPAEIVWVHVAAATLVWVGIVLAAMQVGSPLREPTAETAEAALGATGAPASPARS
jgi:heme A synthase